MSSSTSYSYSLYSSFLPPFSYSLSSVLSVMERANILRIYSAEVSPSRIFASINNGGRGAALCGVQSLWFLYLVRLLAAVLTITSAISRRILSLYITKEVLMSIKTIEGESSDPSRANYVTDFPRDLFPTYAWANVSGTLTGVEILVSMAIIGKLLNTFFTPCWPDRLYAWYPELNRDYCCKFHSGGGGI